MQDASHSKISKSYLFIVLLLMLVLPIAATVVEAFIYHPLPFETSTAGKWLLFWAVGVRLFTAGFKQAINPSFTAKTIFHIQNEESFVIVRELGFANICIGSAAIISLFCPTWRIPAAFSGGLFFGIAGISHLIKKPVSADEKVAMVSDLFIFLVMAAYVINN